jgi:6-pyruvoyltetrahydropterin/6-carboxytetrahydropterin synthase
VTYRISKTFGFSAAHHLPQLPEGHKCRRPHGHNYTVTLVLAARDLDGWGMVLDYGDLDPVRAWIAATLDHRNLNDVLEDPTAERLARFTWTQWAGEFPALTEVTVTETPNTTASYAP